MEGDTDPSVLSVIAPAKSISVPREPNRFVKAWQRFRFFLYNKNTGTILGRTPTSWAQVITFYLVFYGVLAGIFALVLHIFLSTLDVAEPKWQKIDGVIGITPGFSFRPMPPDDEKSTLIWINESTIPQYIAELDRFLEPYDKSHQDEPHFLNCSDQPIDETTTAPSNITQPVCQFDLDENLGPCNAANAYGYKERQPCVLLKINKMYGWEPLPYAAASDVPAEVQDFYTRTFGGSFPIQLFNNRGIYVTCAGNSDLGTKLMGPLTLYPHVIRTIYYPFMSYPHYLSPVIMVKFLNLPVGVVFCVTCKFWAASVKQDVSTSLAALSFEILLSGDLPIP